MAIELMPRYWEALWDAVHVETKEQADRTLEELIKWCQKEDPRINYAEAKAIQLSNIGWFFGEVGPKTQKRAMELYPEAAHPVFGRSFPNLDIVLKTGEAVGKAIKEGKDLATAIKETQQCS